MAAPTFVSNGPTRNTSSASVNASWGTHATNDIGFLLCHSYNSALTPVAVSTPSGWTPVPGVNQVVDNQRLQVFYKFAASSSEADFAVGNPNEVLNTRITTYSGADLSFPIDTSIDGTDSSLSAGTITCPSVTTTGPNRLILFYLGIEDNNATVSSFTNSNLTSITHRLTLNTTNITFSIQEAIAAAEGAIGISSGTWADAASIKNAYAVIALQDEAAPTFPEDLELFEYPPEKVGYNADMGSNILVIPVEGGPARRRQDMLIPPHLLNLQWKLESVDYTKFMGFFTTELRYGRDSFLLDLITDIGIPTPHRVSTMGMMPKLTQQSGDLYVVGCTVQVFRNPTYTGNIVYLEEGMITFNTGGSAMGQLINAGDTVQVCFSSGVHPTGNTPLNLDGRYVVQNVVGNALVLFNPEVINSDWTVLAGLGTSVEYGSVANGNVNSTVFKLPDPV